MFNIDRKKRLPSDHRITSFTKSSDNCMAIVSPPTCM